MENGKWKPTFPNAEYLFAEKEFRFWRDTIDSNPLENLKVLYGTGAIKLNENNEVERVGGVKYTISNGVIYDSKGLLNQVKMMVDKAKKEEGFEIKQPGIN